MLVGLHKLSNEFVAEAAKYAQNLAGQSRQLNLFLIVSNCLDVPSGLSSKKWKGTPLVMHCGSDFLAADGDPKLGPTELIACSRAVGIFLS